MRHGGRCIVALMMMMTAMTTTERWMTTRQRIKSILWHQCECGTQKQAFHGMQCNIQVPRVPFFQLSATGLSVQLIRSNNLFLVAFLAFGRDSRRRFCLAAKEKRETLKE